MNLYLLAQFSFLISLQQTCKNTLSFIMKDPVCSMSLNSDKIRANKLGQAGAKLTRNCWSWTKLFFQKCFYSSNFACLARNNMKRKHLRSAFSIHTKFQHNPHILTCYTLEQDQTYQQLAGLAKQFWNMCIHVKRNTQGLLSYVTRPFGSLLLLLHIFWDHLKFVQHSEFWRMLSPFQCILGT